MKEMNRSFLINFYSRYFKEFTVTIENKDNISKCLLENLKELWNSLQFDDCRGNGKDGDGNGNVGEMKESKTVEEDKEGESSTKSTLTSKEKIEEMHLTLDCLRICLRSKEENMRLYTREFIVQLMFYMDPTLFLPPTRYAELKDEYYCINLSTAAIRCLTNLLNMNPFGVELFLSLNGLTWLLDKIQQGGHVVHMFYYVRLLYMFLSQSEKIKQNMLTLDRPDTPLQSHGTPGSKSKSPCQTILIGTVYESLVTLACSIFRQNDQSLFPYGGTTLDPSPIYAESNVYSGSAYSLARIDTMIDIFKIIYVIKASISGSSSFLSPESFPSPSAYTHLQTLPYLPIPILDYSLHVLLVEILLFPQQNLQPLYDLQTYTLQLFSVMIPQPETFTMILQQIYFPSSSSSPEASTSPIETIKVLLLPLCQSLLRILSIQLIHVSHLFKSPASESQSIAAKLVPILAVLEQLVSKSILAREIIFSLILNPTDTSSTFAPGAPAAKKTGLSPSHSQSLDTQAAGSNLSPTYATPKEFSLFHKLLSLMTSLETYSKRYASEFLFSLCGSDPSKFVEVTGFGNAVALLQMKNLI